VTTDWRVLKIQSSKCDRTDWL